MKKTKITKLLIPVGVISTVVIPIASSCAKQKDPSNTLLTEQITTIKKEFNSWSEVDEYLSNDKYIDQTVRVVNCNDLSSVQEFISSLTFHSLIDSCIKMVKYSYNSPNKTHTLQSLLVEAKEFKDLTVVTINTTSNEEEKKEVVYTFKNKNGKANSVLDIKFFDDEQQNALTKQLELSRIQNSLHNEICILYKNSNIECAAIVLSQQAFPKTKFNW